MWRNDEPCFEVGEAPVPSPLDPRRLTMHSRIRDWVESVRTLDRLGVRHLDVLGHLALVAERRDDSTHEHTRRVAIISYRLARQLKMTAREAAMIGRAAPFHDIGKLCVSDSILCKPGALNAAEFAQVRRHTAVGAKILADGDSELLELAGEIAASHHEHWDGSGYPEGLGEEAIPLSGRIVAVADVFDALTHSRSYKPAWPLSAAIAKIDSLCGTHFDPRVVAAFKRLQPGQPIRAGA